MRPSVLYVPRPSRKWGTRAVQYFDTHSASRTCCTEGRRIHRRRFHLRPVLAAVKFRRRNLDSLHFFLDVRFLVDHVFDVRLRLLEVTHGPGAVGSLYRQDRYPPQIKCGSRVAPSRYKTFNGS